MKATGTRRVRSIIEPQQVLEGAGVRLKRSIATREVNYLDPFLLFDDFGSHDTRDYEAGFPLHPHRGIETVTYMLSGSDRIPEIETRDGARVRVVAGTAGDTRGAVTDIAADPTYLDVLVPPKSTY